MDFFFLFAQKLTFLKDGAEVLILAAALCQKFMYNNEKIEKDSYPNLINLKQKLSRNEKYFLECS